MKIDQISMQGLIETQKKSQTVTNIDFSEVLKSAINKVNDKQIDAEIATQKLINGEAEDIHQVMLETEEARLSLELAVQIRNKLVESYQELSRMQI